MALILLYSIWPDLQLSCDMARSVEASSYVRDIEGEWHGGFVTKSWLWCMFVDDEAKLAAVRQKATRRLAG